MRTVEALDVVCDGCNTQGIVVLIQFHRNGKTIPMCIKSGSSGWRFTQHGTAMSKDPPVILTPNPIFIPLALCPMCADAHDLRLVKPDPDTSN